MLNIIGELSGDAKLTEIRGWGHVIPWCLHEAFEELGYPSRLVNYTDNHPPVADNALLIGRATNMLKQPQYLKNLKSATREKITNYLDWDFNLWYRFDVTFTVVPPKKASERFVYAGWGAPAKYFYPDQQEKTLFFDRLRLVHLKKLYKTNKQLLQTIERVLARTHAKIYVNNHARSWMEMQQILRRCHYHVDCVCECNICECGLTRIEAATCGALLVVPKFLYLKGQKTLNPLEYALWETEEELENILDRKTNPHAISMKARKQTWKKAATRIMNTLEA